MVVRIDNCPSYELFLNIIASQAEVFASHFRHANRSFPPSENKEREDHLADLGADGRIILKWILMK
jgi:hypothetical protein